MQQEVFFKSLGEGAGVYVYQEGEEFVITELTLYGSAEHEMARLSNVTKEAAIEQALAMAATWT